MHGVTTESKITGVDDTGESKTPQSQVFDERWEMLLREPSEKKSYLSNSNLLLNSVTDPGCFSIPDPGIRIRNTAFKVTFRGDIILPFALPIMFFYVKHEISIIY
jgi:hypothetical protein